MEDVKVLYLLYFVSSFLFTVFLSNCLLLQLRKKTGIQFKLYHYNNIGKFIIFVSLSYCLWFIWRKRDFDSNLELFIPIVSFIFVGLKQICGYSKAEVNTCLKDGESIGALWAHQTYDAYYKIVLESIKNRIVSCEKEHNIQILCKKLFIIIPMSCDTSGTMDDKDDAIEIFCSLKSVENDQGANVNRDYKNQVYRISSTRDIYIVAEFSNPVLTLKKSQFYLKRETIHYIRDCYIKTLKLLLQGSPCIVVEYDDIANPAEKLSNCLLSAIEKESNYFMDEV